MRRRLLLVAAILAVALSFWTRPAAAEDCAPVDVGDPAKRFPVILIHGFNGDRSAMQPTRDALVGAGLDVHIVDFEYPCAKTEWVENPNIGLRLQNAVKELADKSMDNGGPGRVAIMGHSMGGLATRQALAGGDLDGRVAFVTTYGTPNLGSGINRVLSLPAPQLMAVKWIVQTIGVPLESDAGRSLQAFSEPIGRLQPFSGGFPVLSLAGDYAIGQRIGWWTSTVSAGDLVVETPSAHAQQAAVDGAGGPERSVCELVLPYYATGPLDLVLAPILDHQWANRPDLANCYHNNLMKDPNLQRITVEQMRTVIDRTKRRTPPDPCTRVVDDLNATGANPYGLTLELDVCEGGWAVAAPAASDDDSGDGLVVASLGKDGRWVKRGVIPGMTCGDLKGLGAPEKVWQRGNGGCNAMAVSDMPPCEADLFIEAYNDFARSGSRFVGAGGEPGCEGVVALMWLTTPADAPGDARVAAFVARSGRWKALTAFRPEDGFTYESSRRSLSEATPEESEALIAMLLDGWLAE